MKKEESKDTGPEKELRDHLRSTFQNIRPQTAAPEELKAEVFDTLAAIQLIADVADLFTVKFTKTASHLADLMRESEEEDRRDDARPEDDPGNQA